MTYTWLLVLFVSAGIAIVVSVIVVLRSRALTSTLIVREREMNSRLYELAILKELQDRFGYSLNVAKIVDIISGSLKQFIDFSVISYVLVEPERLYFKCHLEESVQREFVDEMRQRMLASLSALTSPEIATRRIDETLTGAILTEELKRPIASFFNIPLSIGDRMAGVLTVASTKEGKFQDDDVTIIYKIVKQASQAVSRLEDVLRVEQEKVNAMVESLGDGLLMVDPDFRIIVANPAIKKLACVDSACELTIFHLIDTLGKKLDIRGQLEESIKLKKALVSRDVYIGNACFEVFIAPVESPRTNVGFGAVVVFHDVTHEKELERLRQDFTSMMVHELRSPLDGIHKISSILAKESARGGSRSSRVPSPPMRRKEFREMIDLIGKSSGDMLMLVSDLLDVAKIEAGKFTAYPQQLNVMELVKERFEYFTRIPDHATLNFDANIGTDVTIQGDPMRLKQVLTNLLTNAFKFTLPTGRVTLSVFSHQKGKRFSDEAAKPDLHWFSSDVTGETLENCVVIGVTDTGEGIETEKLPELFNKFKQLQTKSEKRGTGLGLIIAKGIIEAHGGIIGVGSEKGVGSTFFFTLPIRMG